MLVTDGKETDEEASAVIRTVAAKGIRVDVANISTAYDGDDMQLMDSELPDYHLKPGAQCKLSVTVYSKTEGSASVKLYDNGKLVNTAHHHDSRNAECTFPHTFEAYGIHEISFVLEPEKDLLSENNTYYTYLNLRISTRSWFWSTKRVSRRRSKRFRLRRTPGTTSPSKNLSGDEEFPKTLAELRQHDRILLNNIANSDLPADLTSCCTATSTNAAVVCSPSAGGYQSERNG